MKKERIAYKDNSVISFLFRIAKGEVGSPIRTIFKNRGAECVYEEYVLPYLSRNPVKAKIAAVFALNGIMICSNISAVFAVSDFLNNFFVNKNYDAALMDGFRLLGSVSLSNVSGILAELLQRRINLDWANTIRKLMVPLIVTQSGYRISSKSASTPQIDGKTGEIPQEAIKPVPIENIVVSDAGSFTSMSTMLAMGGITNAVKLAAYSAALIKLSLGMFAVTCALSLARIYSAHAIAKGFASLDTESASAFAHLRDYIASLNKASGVVRDNKAEQVSLEMFIAMQETTTRLENKNINRRAVWWAVNQFFQTLSNYSTLFYALTTGFPRKLDEYSATNGSAMATTAPFSWFSDCAEIKARWEACLLRLKDFIEKFKKPTEQKGKTPSYKPEHALALSVEGLAVAKPDGSPLIREVSFHLEGGDRLLLTGPSGSGKSTLLGILTGQNHFQDGEIAYGGLAGDTGEILVLSQNICIFGSSLRQALLWPKSAETGKEDEKFSLEKIKEAITSVGLADRLGDALKDPDNGAFESILSELTRGEKQRFLIARALLHQPPVLILDESTSAIPESTAVDMYRLLNGLGTKTIIISVAHAHLDRLREAHNKEGNITQGKLKMSLLAPSHKHPHKATQIEIHFG